MDIEIIDEKISELRSELGLIDDKINKAYIDEDKDLLYYLFEDRKKVYDSISSLIKIRKCTLAKDFSDGEICLYEAKNGIYEIYLVDGSVFVGVIEYRGDTNTYNTFSGLGDIGYEIRREFRGHSYALSALKLLGEKLYNEGIVFVTMLIHNKNISSIKTTVNFGGDLIEQRGGYLLFKCDLNKIYSFKYSQRMVGRMII